MRASFRSTSRALAAAAWIMMLAAPASANKAKAPSVTVRDVWARATPAGAMMGVIYLTLQSASDDRLVGAEVPGSVAARTEIHETVMVTDSSGGGAGGQMAMRPVSAIDLPAGEAVQLKPGGYHLMLLDLRKPLKPGAHVRVTLTLEKAGKRTVRAAVRSG